MAQELFLIFWVFLLFPNHLVFSQFDEFVFNGFHDADTNMSLNGVAEIDKKGLLHLTNTTRRLIGHAFYSSQIKFKNSTYGKALSFSTAFAFAIDPAYPKLGGHGFAFTISPSKTLPGSLPADYLGLLNATNMGNFSNHILAVEFDTVKDGFSHRGDHDHVGIDINSVESNASVPAAYFVENGTKQKLDLKSGKVLQAWIDYDSTKNRLEVKLSPFSTKPKLPILSFDVDLSPILGENMYVGFSSSTGDSLTSSHYILGWSFNMSGEAESLPLSSLPSLPGPGKSYLGLILAVSLSASLLIIVAAGLAIYLIRKIKNADMIEDWELGVGPHRFSYEELKTATKGFRDRELLGFGGFGKVYKGKLPNSNTQVAVKRISHESKQGLKEFLSEIESIGHLRHRNLVQLFGWCRRGGNLLLVYDYMPNGSLDKYLFDEPIAILNWEQRFKIIKGVASGLLYLHEEWEKAVIHRDIKAGNVLLDSELNGRLGDFGLARLYEHDGNPSTTRVVGTLGYLAPELTRSGKPTTSSDVFAFGALMLEVVCGRRPVEPKALLEELILVDWVWDRWRNGSVLEVVDLRLKGEFDEVEADMVLKLGLMCSNNAAEARPTMREVVRLLEREVPFAEVVAAADAFDRKKGNVGGDIQSQDYVNSYTNSSYFDAQPGPASSLSSFLAGRNGGR